LLKISPASIAGAPPHTKHGLKKLALNLQFLAVSGLYFLKNMVFLAAALQISVSLPVPGVVGPLPDLLLCRVRGLHADCERQKLPEFSLIKFSSEALSLRQLREELAATCAWAAVDQPQSLHELKAREASTLERHLQSLRVLRQYKSSKRDCVLDSLTWQPCRRALAPKELVPPALEGKPHASQNETDLTGTRVGSCCGIYSSS